MPNPFWDFSLAFYGAPGVAEACLALQDRSGMDGGADVNLLLFCCWAGRAGHRLTAAELERLLGASADWQGEVVRPLRAARRWLKAEGGPAEGALRERIKALELEAERIEQDRLYQALPLGPADPSAAQTAENLRLYLDRLGVSAGEEVATLAAAVASHSG